MFLGFVPAIGVWQLNTCVKMDVEILQRYDYVDVNLPSSNIQHASKISLAHGTTESRADTRRVAAATRIQASWRGYIIRRDITVNAKRWLAAPHIQTNVDADWLPAESSSNLTVPALPATPKRSNQSDVATEYPTNQPPRQAWYDASATSRRVKNSHSPVSVVSKPPLPPVQMVSAAETPRTVRSHRQEKITEQWGFKDSTTAELMMKRAKKLSRGSTNKKKSLDPLQRYQQMKKLYNSTKVVSSSKKGIQRQDIFQARDDAILKAETSQRKEKEHKASWTFEWVHSFGVLGSDTSQEHSRQSASEPNLPRMSPTALQGRVQLTASPILDLQSVDGDSSVSSHRPRSQSLTSQHGHERVCLPAVKMRSAPIERRRERQNDASWFLPGYVSRNNQYT